MEILHVTNSIPKEATILLVDLQEKYFKEILEGYDDETIKNEIEKRVLEKLEAMKKSLLSLKKNNHEIYAIVDDEGIYPGFEGIPNKTLPPWLKGYREGETDLESTIFEPRISQELKESKSVIVCGLWLELCQLIVTMKLKEDGIDSYLSTDESLSLRNGMMWVDEDVITLEQECLHNNLQIKLLEDKI